MVQWHIWLLKSSQQRCILTQILKFYDKISCCFFPCQTKHSKIWHCKAYCRRWLCRNSLTEVCVLLKKKIHSDFTSFKTKASDLFIYLFHQFCGRLRTWAGHSGLLLKQSFGQSEKQACLLPSDVGNPWEQACRSCSNRWWVELVTEEILAHWTALCTGGCSELSEGGDGCITPMGLQEVTPNAYWLVITAEGRSATGTRQYLSWWCFGPVMGDASEHGELLLSLQSVFPELAWKALGICT